MSDEEYYKRPEWSYSQMKAIITDGIDYAVAAKRGLLPQPANELEFYNRFMSDGRHIFIWDNQFRLHLCRNVLTNSVSIIQTDFLTKDSTSILPKTSIIRTNFIFNF